ncbi:MAG: tetratricopeptide repeat protein [Acidobacteriota bacterium]
MFLSRTKALQAAGKFMRRAKVAAAIARFERVVERNPSDLSAANSLGDLYVRAGRTVEAAAVFSVIADQYCAGGFLPRALGMLKKIVRLDPGSAEALVKLVELHERLGRTAEALEWQRRFANSYHNDAEPQRPVEVFDRIADLNTPVASPQIEPAEALEISPALDHHELSEDEFVIKQIFRAEVLAIRGGFDEAVAILREILSFAPDNVPARSKLKDVYLRAGLAELAANECLQLARIRESRKMDAIGYLDDELEFGLMIDSPSSDESPSFEHNPDLAPGFEFFAKPISTFNRRNIARLPMSLPVLVTSEDGGWREFAETVNVSRAGALVRLGHSVNPATLLRATLPMPVRLRPAQLSKGLYIIRGLVRHAVPDPGGDHLVGIEFEVTGEAPSEPQDTQLDCSNALTSE